jgi:hypothetical protein
MPIAWKGTLAHLLDGSIAKCRGKAQVLVYDYVDAAVPVLARMAAKRRTGYWRVGYRLG